MAEFQRNKSPFRIHSITHQTSGSLVSEKTNILPTLTSSATSLDIETNKRLTPHNSHIDTVTGPGLQVAQSTVTRRRPGLGYEAFEDDSDDEPGPPALSTYAMSLLEKLDVNDSNAASKGLKMPLGNGTGASGGELFAGGSIGAGKDAEAGIIDGKMSRFKTVNGYSNNNSISRPEGGQQEKLRIDRGRISRRHSRLMPRLRLGAARRVSETLKIAESDSRMANRSGTRNKRPLTATRTPVHIRTGCSPIVKRSDWGETPYKLEPEKTPTKMDPNQDILGTRNLDLLATPEQARRAQIVPASQEKIKRMSFNIWESNKENELRGLSLDFSTDKHKKSARGSTGSAKDVSGKFSGKMDRVCREGEGMVSGGVRSPARISVRDSVKSTVKNTGKSPVKSIVKSPIDSSIKYRRNSVLAEELARQKQQMLAEMSQRSVSDRDNRGSDKKLKQKEPAEAESKRNVLNVNGNSFAVIEQIGKGGSSRVYRAKYNGEQKSGFSRHHSYAIKVVRLEEHEQSTVDEFKGEVSLLQKLQNEERVVKLLDYATSAKSLMFVMEFGEIDLAHVMASHSGKPFDLEFVRYHTREIIKCVCAVHRAGVVHSDLKPANFVFVRGVMKLIDFGISNPVSDHTVNVYRECQMGTPNYMAPETLVETENVWKVGKPADIWSCGCIIYQLCYGKPPYAQYPGTKKIMAITNPQLQITYPRTSPHGGPPVNCLAIDTMRKCLRRDPAKRATADELLEMPFITPKTVTERFMGDLVRNAVKYGAVHPDMSEKKIELLVKNVWKRVNEYC